MKKVFVYPGFGYLLEELDLSNYEDDSIELDEICYMCLLSNKGYIIPHDEMDEEDDDRFVLCDISMYNDEFDENLYYFCIENFQAENIEVY